MSTFAVEKRQFLGRVTLPSYGRTSITSIRFENAVSPGLVCKVCLNMTFSVRGKVRDIVPLAIGHCQPLQLLSLRIYNTKGILNC